MMIRYIDFMSLEKSIIEVYIIFMIMILIFYDIWLGYVN